MRALFVLLLCLVSSPVFATDCRYTEYPDRIEVVCEGDQVPTTNNPPLQAPVRKQAVGIDGLTDLQREYFRQVAKENVIRIKREVAELERQEQERLKQKPEAEVKVSSVSAMQMSRTDSYVTMGIKADVDNLGDRGEVFIKLVGKNWTGHEIDFVYLRGTLERKQSRTLSTTALLTDQQVLDIRTWEVDSVNKY
jgi:hypothetical protein